MGVKIVVGQQEPIELALKRFRKVLERDDATWESRRRAYFIKPTQVRRARRFQKRFKARRATLLAQKAGKQPVISLADAIDQFWTRTGKR